MKRLTREHLVPNEDGYALRRPAIEIDTADLRNGGVFLEDDLEDIPTQIRTVFYDMPLGPLLDSMPTPTSTVSTA